MSTTRGNDDHGFSRATCISPTILFAGLIAVWFVAGCGGGIPISEEAVFEAKSSITPATFDREDAELEETFFGDDPSIHGWHFDRDDSRCTTVFFGGQRFHMVLARRRVEALLERIPTDVLMFDYRGYGRSGGEATVEGLKADAIEAIEHARQKFGTDCIVAHGHSVGTFLATWVAKKDEVDALVLEAPVVSADRFVGELVPWYLRLFIGFDIDPAFDGENNADRAADIEVPTLLIAGEEDNIAPPAHARTIRDRAAGDPTRLTVFEEGSHNNLYLKEGFGEDYRELLCEAGRCNGDG
jgi:pimeloyl-ACP methyl ester carboxylesterase